MLRAVLVENWIGIVDMDQNFAALDVLGVLLEHSARAGEGHVTDPASSFLAGPGFNEFFAAPESSVDEGCVAIFDPGTPCAGVPVGCFCLRGNCRGIKYFLITLVNHKCRRGFLGD